MTALNLKYKAFIVHLVVFNINSGDEIHPSRRALIAHLKTNKASTKVSSKYIEFAIVFSPILAIELPKYMGINNHAIRLIDN